MTTETLSELAEIVLKKNFFQFNEKTLKPYAIMFMVELEERILEDIELQPRIW